MRKFRRIIFVSFAPLVSFPFVSRRIGEMGFRRKFSCVVSHFDGFVGVDRP